MENQKPKLFTIQDIWNERDKNEPIDPRKKYDPQFFWDDYGESYYKAHEKREQIQFGLGGNNPVAWLIFKLISLKVDTVLEAGCGFGRLAPFILDGKAAKEYHGIDFSEKILECHKLYLKDYIYKDHVHFQKASAKHVPFSDGSIDCVITNELLMHMTRTKADHCIREFRRVAQKNIILIERFVYAGEHPYPHVWSHDWIRLASSIGLTALESKIIGNGIMGTIFKV